MNRVTQGEIPDDRLVLVGLGANLPSAFGDPPATLLAALGRLQEAGVKIVRRSRFWRSEPVPVSDQPWFVNAVAVVETDLPPNRLLALLHEVEAAFGRVRSVVNAPRLLDLDLLAYGREISETDSPILPHPRLHQRAFVLMPLADIAPDWRHPASGQGVSAMIARLPPGQRIEPFPSGEKGSDMVS